MALQVPAIVEDAADFDKAVPAYSVDDEMAWFKDSSTPHPIPAEEKVVCPDTLHQLRPGFRCREQRVSQQVEKGLCEQSLITQGCNFAKVTPAPLKN